jgi:hypothetical protein
MAYLGRQPIIGNYQVLDAITATTTDTYALTKNSVAVFPQTPANCIVSLNGVIQAPTDSYTISGSDIVFASALTGSDSIDFITVLGDVLNVGTVSDGTIGLAKLSATGTKDDTTFLRGDNTFQTIGTNTPAFSVYLTSGTSLTNNTLTKVSFDTENYDSNHAVSSGTFTVPAGQGGKYFIYAQLSIACTSQSSTWIYKNGSTVTQNVIEASGNYFSDISSTASALLNLTAGDYIEIYGRGISSGTVSLNGGSASSQRCTFSGYKIIE